jgi:hypothetical protein
MRITTAHIKFLSYSPIRDATLLKNFKQHFYFVHLFINLLISDLLHKAVSISGHTANKLYD